MGAVIMFPRVRRGSCETQPPMADVSAAVIILPAIRIERTYDAPPAIETKATRSPSGRKRAAPALPSPGSDEGKRRPSRTCGGE